MSVALKQTWTPEKRFSASEPNEDQSFSSFDDQDKDANGWEKKSSKSFYKEKQICGKFTYF